MYGLPDSAVVGAYKRGKSIGKSRRSAKKNQDSGLLFAYLIVLLIQKLTKKN